MVLISTFVALTFTITEALSMQMCGKALADMLDFVCDGRGFHWIQRDGGLPTISKRNAVQYLNKRSNSLDKLNHGGGVVQECCRKSCSLEHLESYCAAAPGTYYPNPTGGPIPQESARELMSIRTTTPPVMPIHVTTPRPPPVTKRPPGRKLSPVMSTRVGKAPMFFFVRGMMEDRPTRSPVTHAYSYSGSGA